MGKMPVRTDAVTSHQQCGIQEEQWAVANMYVLMTWASLLQSKVVAVSSRLCHVAAQKMDTARSALASMLFVILLLQLDILCGDANAAANHHTEKQPYLDPPTSLSAWGSM